MGNACSGGGANASGSEAQMEFLLLL